MSLVLCNGRVCLLRHHAVFGAPAQNGVFHPFGNIGGMVSNALQVLGHHQLIQVILTPGVVLRDAGDQDVYKRQVKDRLKTSALGMSGGQQQRLCIARALAVQPDILLLDESTSALDPISTSKIEDLIGELKKEYTVIMVTHNMQQAVRISDMTAFFLLGELIEFGETEQIFSMPKNKKTEDYISGRFG